MILLSLIAGGALLRIIEYGQRRSLYIDDAMLMLNVVTRGYGDLLKPLSLEQSAPPLYLWAQRLVVTTLGASELAVRALSLVAGLAILPATWLIARRFFDRQTALFAVAMLAVAPPVIYYSTSAKPYEADILVGIILMWLGIRVLDFPTSAQRSVIGILGGVAAMALSMPAVFVLGGVWAAWLADPAIRRTKRGRAMLLESAAAWAATFFALYLFVYAPGGKSEYMRQFWDGAFLSSQPTIGSAAAHVAHGVLGTLYGIDRSGPLLLGVALSVLLLVGVSALVARRQFVLASLLATPVVLPIVASALGQYILWWRFMLHAAPLLCILVSHGLTTLTQRIRLSPARQNILRLACALAIVLVPVRYSFWFTRHPENAEASRPIIETLLARSTAAEPVYVYARALPLWTYYTTDWKRPDTSRVRRLMRDMSALGGNSGNGPSRGRKVDREGFDRRYPYREASEVLGIATGMQNTCCVHALAPDSGWAQNEALRIRAAASPSIWIVIAHYSETPLRELQTAMESLGGHATYANVTPGAALFQYRFEANESAGAARPPAATGVVSTR